MNLEDLPEAVRRHLVEDGDCWVLRPVYLATTPRPMVNGKRMALGKWVHQLLGKRVLRGKRLEALCGNPRCYRHQGYSPEGDYCGARYRRMQRALYTDREELFAAARALKERGYRQVGKRQVVLPCNAFRIGRGKGGNTRKEERWWLYWQPPRRALEREGLGRIQQPQRGD